jgi:hypothetical protein
MKKQFRFLSFILIFTHLLSCSAYRPLTSPYAESVHTQLKIGDNVRIKLSSGYTIKEMIVEEILGDSVIIGSQTFKKTIASGTGTTEQTTRLSRQIKVSEIAEISKSKVSVGLTFLGLVVVPLGLVAFFTLLAYGDYGVKL